jgi:hypothetical protein
MQGEWMLHIHLKGALLASNYAGYETRKNNCVKKLLDCLSGGKAIMALSVVTLGLAIAAISGPAYSFIVDDITTGKGGFTISFAIGSILKDVRRVDFPTGVCFVFVVLFPLLTPTMTFFWAITGQKPTFGLWCTQAARMCCMDVFFISGAVLGSEFGRLIPAVVHGVNNCYTVAALASFGWGLGLCVLQALCMVLLSLAVQHKVEWTLSPELPYRADPKATEEEHGGWFHSIALTFRRSGNRSKDSTTSTVSHESDAQ